MTEAMERAVLEQEGVEDVRIPTSKEAFLECNPDDGFLYEYANGFAEQTTGVKNKELHLISNIQDAFAKTLLSRERGKLFEEADVWVGSTQKRIPDMALW